MKQENNNNNNNDWITNLACNALFFVGQLAVRALFVWLEGKSSTEVHVKRHIRGEKIIKENTHAAGRRMKRDPHMTIQDYVAHQRKHEFLPNAGVKESTDEGQRAMSTKTPLMRPPTRPEAFFSLTTLASMPRIARVRAGKIMIACSDCAQVLRVIS